MIVFAQPKAEVKEKKTLIPEVNIGIVGHVDHGKTTLNQAITGKWTDTHSEEIKRGITIRLGYADAVFYYCSKCKKYSNAPKCSSCFGEAEPERAVSFIDAPGHETLMATVLSGAALMDGALLVIAANEKCPQPQTAEHLKALDIVGIRNIIIVQNKIDLVSEERAIEHYQEIKKFVKGTITENAPVIPVSAINNANIDALIDAIEEHIKTPDRDINADPKFYIARSFDVNKPGTALDDLVGGVVGGSLTQGLLRSNSEIEIRPGVDVNGKWTPLRSKIVEIVESAQQLNEAMPGGLVALRTELDPAITRGDGLVGNILGLPEKLPPVFEQIKLKIELFDYVIGVEGHQKVHAPRTGEPLLITAAIAKTVGVITSAAGKTIEIKLKLPICAEKNDKVAIAAQVGGRWHLIGYGVIV